MAFPDRNGPKANSEACTVMVVEDEERISQILGQALIEAGYEVIRCSTIRESQWYLDHEIGLYLVDLGLPDGDGIQLCRSIREGDPEVPIMMVTAKDGVDHRVRGLDAGADDYVVKPFEMAELLARIRSLLRRTQAQPAHVKLQFGDLWLDAVTRKVGRGDVEISVKRREFELLLFLARNPNRPWTRDQLLERVWGRDFDGGPRTVDVHIRRLRMLVEKNPEAPTLITTKYGIGYVFARGMEG